MQKWFGIGNLTKDPELRTTQDGKTVCNFTIAINRRKTKDGKEEVDFFRISAWNQLGENCGKYLSKGKKVAVTGEVRQNVYIMQNGTPGASMEVSAQDVEFLTPRGNGTPVDIETPWG